MIKTLVMTGLTVSISLCVSVNAFQHKLLIMQSVHNLCARRGRTSRPESIRLIALYITLHFNEISIDLIK